MIRDIHLLLPMLYLLIHLLAFFTTKVEKILIKGSVKALPLWQET